VLDELRFVHHRPIGGRERSRRQAWSQAGHAARYMGYRPSYVVLRAAHHILHGDASAVALVGAYAAATVRRAPQCPDPDVRSVLRQKQALRNLPTRAREVSGRTSLAASSGRVDLLLVADPGGHLSELVALREVWSGFSRAWVTVAGVDTDAVPTGEHVLYARGPTQRSLLNLIRNTIFAARVLRNLRPAVVLTTGSGLAVPFAWVARLLGAQVVYIECSGRIGVSLSGRLVGPVVSRFYAQWPEAASRYGRARYAGTIFFSSR
jgi:beta-1,4-N-acetylglucosaminyltransferase